VNVDYTKQFKKQYQKLSQKTQQQCDARLSLFMSKPTSPLLRVHILHGALSGCSSINISGDIRVVFQVQDDGVILFVAIGTHEQLYS
jgi:addiction module RelE/StbE family toxin